MPSDRSTELIKPVIDDSWLNLLQPEFQADYFFELKRFLVEEQKRYTVYPQGKDIFNAFNLTPLPSVKAVIIGQDPYHGPASTWLMFFC